LDSIAGRTLHLVLYGINLLSLLGLNAGRLYETFSTITNLWFKG